MITDLTPSGSTFFPALPARSRLTIVELTPVRLAATYPTRATGLYWALSMVLLIALFFPLAILTIILGFRLPWLPPVLTFFAICAGVPCLVSWLISLIFRRPAGGRVCLEEGTLHFERGTIFPSRRDVNLKPGAQLGVSDVGGEESTHFALQLLVEGKATIIASQSDLTLADLQWLARRMNEWLGQEFPSQCLQCGRALKATDLDWPTRAVCCSECGYRGRGSEPLAGDIVPPPIRDCPSCQDPIRLQDVSRITGGCRCRHCGWSSDAAPPMELDDPSNLPSYVRFKIERGVVKLIDRKSLHMPLVELVSAFPTEGEALEVLRQAELVEESTPGAMTVKYAHWQTARLWLVYIIFLAIFAESTRFMVNTRSIAAADRSFIWYWNMFASHIVFLLLAATLVGLAWWTLLGVKLTFTPNALEWTVGSRKRLIAWHTLSDVVVLNRRWPPVVLLRHGGTGLLLVTPTSESARAIGRLCLFHREKAGRPNEANSAESVSRWA
jgi:hypothetical protein